MSSQKSENRETERNQNESENRDGEKNQRKIYMARFDISTVERACRKANWHRARALKLGRTHHFSAWQWLDLCESRGWDCAYCAANEPLEPHHVWELHRGGENSIENIEAICKACHEHIHEWPDDVSAAWMEWQLALLTRFRRFALQGESVRLACGTREQNQTRRRGVLMEFIAPEAGKVPLRGILPRGKWGESEPFVAVHALNADWWENRARAKVQWHAGGMWEETLPLSHLARRERENLVAAQQLLPSHRRAHAAVQFSLRF